VALNCYYDHAGGWHSFAERVCHRRLSHGRRRADRASRGWRRYRSR
jgi:hypothetical protein